MTTRCSRCGRDNTHNEKEDDKYVYCDRCKLFFTPKGANSNKLKGGVNMAGKKTSSNLLKCIKCKRMVQKSTRNPDRWKGKEGKFACRSCNKK